MKLKPTAQLTLIYGPTRSGKSTLAACLADKLGGVVVDNYEPARAPADRAVKAEAFRQLMAGTAPVFVCAAINCRPYNFPPTQLICIQHQPRKQTRPS